MLWRLEWGEKVEFLVDLWKETGAKPQALNDFAPLPARLSFYMDAFDALVNDRQIFMGGASPISFAAVDRWARRHGVTGDHFQRLFRAVQALDRVWLVDYAKKLKAATPTR